jgi:hypothetical protein
MSRPVPTPPAGRTAVPLAVDDVVDFTGIPHRNAHGGVVIAIADRTYVRWPDGKVGAFEHQHAAKHLRKVVP